MLKVGRTIAALVATAAASGCLGPQPSADSPVVNETSTAPPLAIPTDGTWDQEASTSVAGFGRWSDRGGVRAFEFMIDTPPTVEQVENSLHMRSEVKVRRAVEDSRFDLADIHASLWPGVSIVDESGNLRFDESYGGAGFTCPVTDLQVGEETTCTVGFTESSHPEWLQDSYWQLNDLMIAAWPSQTAAP